MKASLVWTSKFRPDGTKQVIHNSGLDAWLARRGLKWEEVAKLVDGKMAPVPEELATR